MPCGANGTLIEVSASGVVQVTGTTDGSGCQSFSVSVANLTVFKPASPDGNGDWTVTFSGGEITGDLTRFRQDSCGRTAKISIRCDDAGSTCNSSDEVTQIVCERDPGRCPAVEFTITPGDCAGGTRTVHIVAEVTSPADATYVWFFGTDEDNQPGEDSQAGDGAGTLWLPAADANGIRTVEVDHVYEPAGATPQTVTVRLETTTGPGNTCSAQQSFTLEPCAAAACPTVTWSADISPQCDANGFRTVVVTATIDAPQTTISGSLLDALGNVVASGSQANSLTLLSPSLSLGGGDHDFRVQLTNAIPAGCAPDLQHTVSVPDCPGGSVCPTVVWSERISDCNDDRTRDVQVSASVSSFGTPITAELRSPQGAVLDTSTTPPNGTITLASGSAPFAPGNHQFRVAFTAGLPRGCAVDDTHVVTVPGCGQPPGNEGFGCFLLRVIALAFLIGGLVAIFGGACSGNGVVAGAGVASALLGAALLITWAALCAPGIGCLALQKVIALVNLLIAVIALITLIMAVLAALGIVVGWPCLIGAFVDLGILSALQLVLWQMFVARGCDWEGDSIFS